MIIFLFIIAGILIFFGSKQLKSNNFEEVLHKADKEMTDEKKEIIRLRNELSTTVLELQTKMEDLQNEIDYLKYKQIERQKEGNKDFIIKDEAKKFTQSNVKLSDNIIKDSNPKVDKIVKMLDKGMSDDEICDDLKVGKGELLLIKELYN